MLNSKLAMLFWSVAIAMIPLGTLVGIFLTVPSGYFLRVTDYDYNPATETVTMVRNVLSDEEVVARSYITVTGADGRSCFDRDERLYSPTSSDGRQQTVDVFPAPSELKPCFASAPYTIVANFQVRYLGGTILLKPTWYFEPPRSN